MNEKKISVEKIILTFFSLMGGMMLTMKFQRCGNSDYLSNWSEVMDNLRLSLWGKSFITSFIALVLYRLGIKRFDKELPKRAVFVIFSFLMAIIWLFAECFKINNKMYHISESYGQILKSFIYVFGATFLIYECVCGFNHILFESEKVKAEKLNTRIGRLNDKSLFWVICISLLMIWSVNIVVSYPCNTSNDTWMQLSQFFGYSDFTAHHPPIHTMMIGFFTWLGYKCGSANVGIFLFILVQAIIYALVLAYSFLLLRKIKSPNWLQIIYYVVIAITPFYANSVTSIIKDSLYSVFVLLFIIELVYGLIDAEKFFGMYYHYILSVISIMGVLLFRNNGKHILYPTILLIIIALIIKRKQFSKRVIVSSLIVLVGSVLLASGLEDSVKRLYNIKDGSIVEALSLPLQQTSRTVIEHANEITLEERNAIDAIIIYDEIAQKYDPRISDPIKDNRRGEPDKETLSNYLVVWFKMFFKYPKSYFAATINQNYVLVYPFEENNTIHTKFFTDKKELIYPMVTDLEIHEVSGLQKCRDVLYYFNVTLFSLPFIGVLCHTSLYVILLFVLTLLAILKRKSAYLISTLPLLLSVAVVILAPVIKGHPRYVFPIIYAMPVLIGYYIYLVREDTHSTSGDGSAISD